MLGIQGQQMCHCLRVACLESETVQAVITQLPNGLNGFNSLQLPESGPSTGEGSRPVSPLLRPSAELVATAVEKGSIMWHLCYRRGFPEKSPSLFIT